jgi:hypothetical protein
MGGHEPKMPAQKSWHKDVTSHAILEAVERSHRSLDNPGFCLASGVEVEGVEPDARRYECEACGEWQVYGAEELLLYADEAPQ